MGFANSGFHRVDLLGMRQMVKAAKNTSQMARTGLLGSSTSVLHAKASPAPVE